MLASSFAEFMQHVVSGLASGGVFALLALALVIIHRSTGVINFAQGEMATLSAYIAWTLIVNHGWLGLLIDGNPDNIARGKAFYATCKTTWPSPPALVEAWVTRDNVNQLVVNHRVVLGARREYLECLSRQWTAVVAMRRQ